MKYISLFSGIEAATVAWQTLGWEPVAYAEIEPFPKAVLKHHYPNVPDLGDMTKVNWKEYHHAADVVVGGSPCQAFSIAGLRKALDDPRGQLMLEYLRACAEIPWKGKKHTPDSPRYKALGNSMAVPVMRWIGEGIQLVEDNKGLFQENPSEQ